MAAVKSPEMGSLMAGGCPGVCGACSRACFSKPQTIRGESGSGAVLVVSSVEGLLKLPKLPIGRIYFSSDTARSESREPLRITSEEICSKCNKKASTCPHAEPSKN